MDGLSQHIEALRVDSERASSGAASLLCEQSDMLHMFHVQMNWAALWRRLKGHLRGEVHGGANSSLRNSF